MKIIELTDKIEQKWDEYVTFNKETTFFHQLAWRNAVVDTYGFTPLYLIAEKENKIKGILPLFLIKEERRVVSVPFAPYGGPCCDDLEIRHCFLEKLIEILIKENIRYIELRLFQIMNNQRIFAKAIVDIYVTSLLKLESNPDNIWFNKMSGYVRNRTKKAIRGNLNIERGSNLLPAFYKVYARAIRDLGTPPHSIGFLKSLIMESPQNTDILLVRKDNKVIGGMFLLFFKDTIINMWSFSLKRYFNLCPNNLLYWEAITYGCRKGYKVFDMGRSLKNSGVLHFKSQWGAQRKQLYYMCLSGQERKTFQYSQLDYKRRIFSTIWSHMPLYLSTWIGPRIRRRFP